jgi:hypothetical protein
MKQNDRYCGSLLISASTNEADIGITALDTALLKNLEKIPISANLGA